MKFARYLETKSIPEWRKAYINYKGLKKRLAVIERYQKTHHIQEQTRLQNAIANLEDNVNTNNRMPNRTQSSILDDRLHNFPRNVNSELKHRSKNRNLRSLSILDQVLRHASEPEQYFFVMLDQDLQTIANFYDEKEKEAEAKYDALKMQVQIIHDFAVQLSHFDESHDRVTGDSTLLNPANWFRRRGSTDSTLSTEIPDLPASLHYNGDQHLSYNVARNRLKKAITEYYRSLELLKNYKELNELGFQKILKKFDKTAGWKASTLYMDKVHKYHWVTSHKIELFIEETEKLYIDEFAEGHRRKGMSKLRTPEVFKEFTWTTCRIGFYIGLSMALFIRVTQLALDEPASLPHRDYNLQIYACFALPILFCLGFAINTMVWTRSHINYKFIFEFDPRDNLDYHEFAELPSLMLLLLGFVMYLDFSQSFAPLVPPELCPLIFFVIAVAIMTCPFPILYYSSRRWLSLSLGRIVLSYLFPIEFRDFFIADELNSLAYSFWTFSYFVCAYRVHWTDLDTQCPVKKFWFTPLVACLPPWWRFLQCIRRYQDSRERVHLVNAVKYVTSMASTLASGYRRIHPEMEVVWIICGMINSSYTSAWDLKMDWGLFQTQSRHFLLRDDLVFPRWTYYVAVPINVMLRFAWTLNAASLGFKGELVGFVTALLEAYRRIQWNFFRLENEHINNCGNYRAIKEIPLPFAFHGKSTEAVVEEEEQVEEGRIQLPLEEQVAVPPTAHAGSFYGRRDFENRQELEDVVSSVDVKRQSSMVGVVLDRLRSRHSTNKTSDDSSSDDDTPSA